MNDVRDEALGAVLDREAARIESAPVDRLPEVLRRGSRMRAIRFTAVAAAVAIFAGAVSWAGLQYEGRGTIPAAVDDWRTYASLEDNGWTVQVPPPWQVQELPACPNAPERIGVIVTNVDFEFLSPRGERPECEDRFVFHGFPSDGVAFAFQPVGVRWGIFQPEPRTTFPLTPDRLRSTNSLSGGASQTFLDVGLDGELFAFVRRWVGPDASAADVDALDRMLASLQVRSNDRWTETDGGLTTLHDEKDNYVVTYPADWIVADENLTPWLSSPWEILSLGTFPLRVSEDPEDGLRIWDAPVVPAALADMTSDDALVSLQEAGLGGFGDRYRRPVTFGPRGCEESILECTPQEDPFNVPFDAWWIPFKDAGRGFYLFVAIGNEATPELREQAWAVANSLAFAEGGA